LTSPGFTINPASLSAAAAAIEPIGARTIGMAATVAPAAQAAQANPGAAAGMALTRLVEQYEVVVDRIGQGQQMIAAKLTKTAQSHGEADQELARAYPKM